MQSLSLRKVLPELMCQATGKQNNKTHHCWMLHVASVSPRCMLLDVVRQSLKPVKLFSQQLPTFLWFRDRRSVAQQCWKHLQALPTLLGLHTRITNGLYGVYKVLCVIYFPRCTAGYRPRTHHTNS